MSEELIGQIARVAYNYKSMAGLARALEIEVAMLRYHLAKKRKLDEVKAILRSNQKRFQ